MSITPKILRVDDEVDFTELLAANLEASGFEVKQVNNPREALTAAREFRPDICIIDLVMPHMDGGDVVSAIHSDCTLAKTPIIMLTALVEENLDSSEGIQMKGGLPFISKTSGLKIIINAINKYLDQAA